MAFSHLVVFWVGLTRQAAARAEESDNVRLLRAYRDANRSSRTSRDP